VPLFRNTPPLPQDGIYRTILMVLVIDIVAGALLAVAGESLFQRPALSDLGTALALIGAALYVFFRFLGARQAKREAGEDEGRDQDQD
jgi:hypothetical protein